MVRITHGKQYVEVPGVMADVLYAAGVVDQCVSHPKKHGYHPCPDRASVKINDPETANWELIRTIANVYGEGVLDV